MLDPGSGTGVLSAAVCEAASRSGAVQSLHLDPDDPGLPTNSPCTHYGLTDEALNVLRLYRGSGWEAELKAFRSSHGALLEIYQRRRQMREIPIRTSTGEEIRLSPGRHNRLQALVVTAFGPRFAPGSTLLYLGDAADKLLHLDRDKLDQLKVPVTEHDKLPDVVLYDEGRNWLFLVEAVTSHGPVSPKRLAELEAALKDCIATRLYVSAFPDFPEFRRHLENIAWETKVWVAEIPDHLIHFTRDRLLGPKEKPSSRTRKLGQGRVRASSESRPPDTTGRWRLACVE